MKHLPPANLSDISSQTLWSLGKFLEHDSDIMATAPVFVHWLHPLLIAEHQRRRNEPEAPPAPLVMPATWTPKDIADALLGVTALSYAEFQDGPTAALLDALTFGIVVRAANELRKLDGPATAYKGN